MNRLLFANVEFLSLFPENFWQGVLGTLVYFALALILFPIGYKVCEFMTPGHLTKQLLGHDEGQNGHPNVALGIVVGCIMLGMCHILASAIK